MNDEDLLEGLVRIASPTGQEAEAVRFLQEQARADGLRVHEDEVGNFITQAGRGERLLLFVGHVDTVPGDVPVRVEDEVLWGRGSVDAKGSLAAACCAARRFADDERFRVLVVGAVGEEGDSRGVKGLQVQGTPEWIINGEPSGASGLTLAYKGIVRGTLTVEAETGHGAGPQPGAADLLVRLWSRLRESFAFEAAFDSVQGRLDSLSSSADGLVERAEAGFQLRLPPSWSVERARDVLEQEAASCGAQVVVHESLPAVVAPRRSSLVAAFTSAIRATGGTPRLLRKTGTSDMNHLASRWPGTPIAAYGPGDSALDHRPDERLPLAEYRQAVEVLEQVFATFARAQESPRIPRPA